MTDNLVGFQFSRARCPPTRRVWLQPCTQLGGAWYSTPSTASHLTRPVPEAQMNNPMVDVDLKANTTKAELPWLSGQRNGNGMFETLQFKAVFSWTMPRTAHGHTPRLSRYMTQASRERKPRWQRQHRVPNQRNGNRVPTTIWLTYTNSWGDHSVTGSGFTTYYNKNRESERRPYPRGRAWSFRTIPTNGTKVSATQPPPPSGQWGPPCPLARALLQRASTCSTALPPRRFFRLLHTGKPVAGTSTPSAWAG